MGLFFDEFLNPLNSMAIAKHGGDAVALCVGGSLGEC